jgi:hypothetical protein
MSKQIDNGGSVTADLISERYVVENVITEVKKLKSVGGLSIRDYFAAAALTGFATNNETVTSDLVLAKWSYSVADAMIEVRKGGEQP